MADYFGIHNLNLEVQQTADADIIGRIKDTNTLMEYFYFKGDNGEDISNGNYNLLMCKMPLPCSFLNVKYEVVLSPVFRIKIISRDRINPKSKTKPDYNSSPFLVCIGKKFTDDDELISPGDMKWFDSKLESNDKASCGTLGCRTHLYYHNINHGQPEHIKVFATTKTQKTKNGEKQDEHDKYDYYIPLIGHGAVGDIVYRKMSYNNLIKWLEDAYKNKKHGIAIDEESSTFETCDSLDIIIYPDAPVRRTDARHDLTAGNIYVKKDCINIFYRKIPQKFKKKKKQKCK